LGTYQYVGAELELFSAAVGWKRYLQSQLAPFIRGDVLDVGAGLGTTARSLCSPRHRSWLLLEPDARFKSRLDEISSKCGACDVRAQNGTLSDLAPDLRFDTILYVDVLEHIDDDAGELERARVHLRRGGSLIVVSPAFAMLMSPFDRSLGHIRRYTRRSLTRAFPRTLRQRHVRYLDSVGALAALANRLILRQSMPTPAQVAVWDRVFVSLSRALDPVLHRWFGRSIVAVYELL
jgi:SAM-dependent methyltransferase